ITASCGGTAPTTDGGSAGGGGPISRSSPAPHFSARSTFRREVDHAHGRPRVEGSTSRGGGRVAGAGGGWGRGVGGGWEESEGGGGQRSRDREHDQGDRRVEDLPGPGPCEQRAQQG